MTAPELEPFADRRLRFAAALGDAIAVIPGALEVRRNGDVNYEFRQSSDFFFLPGFDEPDAVAVINPAHAKERYVLFVRPRDREMEIWNGRRAGVEGAVATYGADAAYPIDLLDEKLREYLIGRRALCYRLGNAAFDGRITRLLAELRLARARGLQVPVAVEDPAPLLAELRLRRSPAELERHRRACAISRDAPRRALRGGARGRAACAGRGARGARPRAARARGHARDAPLPRVLYARHRPLARHGRARRGRLPGRGQIARARAGDGLHRRARPLLRPGSRDGDLLPPRVQRGRDVGAAAAPGPGGRQEARGGGKGEGRDARAPHPEGISRHRRPHRGRRADHRRRRGGAHRGHAEDRGRDRARLRRAPAPAALALSRGRPAADPGSGGSMARACVPAAVPRSPPCCCS